MYYKARKGAHVEKSESVVRRKRKDYKKAYSPSAETNRKRYSPLNNKTSRKKEITHIRSYNSLNGRYIALNHYNSLLYGSKFQYNYHLVHKDKHYYYYEAKPGKTVSYKKSKEKVTNRAQVFKKKTMKYIGILSNFFVALTSRIMI